MPTYRLFREQWIPRPRPEVFAFFAEAENLEAITPPWLHFRILSERPIRMAAGTRIDYRLRLYGIPLGWQTRIERFEPDDCFSDRQVRGPYRLWYHLHEFADDRGGTRMRDTIDYQIPYGPLGRLAGAWFVRRSLDQIFAYRRRRIEDLLGSAGPGS